MEKYFPVHIYGQCGNFSCPENDSGPTYNIKSKCFDYISENYMFYLSFENSMCLDYVTEKFFKALNFGILPIVLGKYNWKILFFFLHNEENLWLLWKKSSFIIKAIKTEVVT